MTLVIETSQMLRIERHAERSGREECCGVLVGSSVGKRFRVSSVVEAENVYEGDRSCRYTIDPQRLLTTHRQAREAGCEVVGYYHSHPESRPEPSGEDAAHAWPGIRCLIIGRTAAQGWEARCWSWSGGSGFREERVEIVDEAG